NTFARTRRAAWVDQHGSARSTRTASASKLSEATVHPGRPRSSARPRDAVAAASARHPSSSQLLVGVGVELAEELVPFEHGQHHDPIGHGPVDAPAPAQEHLADVAPPDFGHHAPSVRGSTEHGLWLGALARGRLAAMKIVPVFALLAITCGGSGFGGQSCTEIGCSDGLTVVV